MEKRNIIKKLEKNVHALKDKDNIVLVKLSLHDAKDLAAAFAFDCENSVLSDFKWAGISFDLTSSSSYIVCEQSIHILV
jgi:hypothetical protein